MNGSLAHIAGMDKVGIHFTHSQAPFLDIFAISELCLVPSMSPFPLCPLSCVNLGNLAYFWGDF